MKLRALGVEDGDDYIASRDDLGDKTIANHVTLLMTMLRLATTFNPPWLLVRHLLLAVVEFIRAAPISMPPD